MFFRVSCGIRQGGVLSPFLFAVYVDGIVRKVDESDLGCRLGLKRKMHYTRCFIKSTLFSFIIQSSNY